VRLIDQLREVAIRRVNEPWWRAVGPPRAVTDLAAKAFVENWDRDSFDARVVLRACQLFESPGHIGDAPGIERAT
jgi:hypothetical protein